MEIRILGPLEVTREGETVTLPGGRARALLALLAIWPNRVVSTDRLIDQLWGETSPPTARTKLQGLVSTLRKRIGDGGAVIATHPPGYALAVDPANLDAERFRRLVERARESDSVSQRARLLHMALDEWRGPALADFTYEPFAQSEIMALEELRLEAREERIDADLALGGHGDLVAELQALAAEHPLRERLTGQLMLALYRSGRQADALAVYRDARRYLVQELGVEPGPDLQDLEDRVLAQDETLLPASPAVEAAGPGGTWLGERRKPATVAFVALSAADPRADAETSRDAVEAAYHTVSEIVREHGGAVQGLLGDVAVAVFGIPTAHEDDAHRAARSAIAVRRALAESHQAVRFRAGINTGDIVVGDARGRPSGTTVALTSRLQQAAPSGQIRIGSTTRRLLGESAVTVPAPDGEEAWRLVDVVTPEAPSLPMIGRTGELADLDDTYRRAVEDGSPVLVEVRGEAGIGKSRLVREFASRLDDRGQVLTGNAVAYGEGITFWPLREMVLDLIGQERLDGPEDLVTAAGLARETVAQVAGAAGLMEYPGDPRRLFGAAGEFFTALARRRPLVLVGEDMHWAEPTFRDLLYHLPRTADGPILIVCVSRPEAVTHADGGAVPIELQPLGRPDVERLVANRSGGRRLSRQTLDRVVETVRGNPLFAEQTVAALGDDETVQIPPSVEALLAARLDRLGPGERDVARAAAVWGTELSMPALAALLPDEARPYLARHIRALQERRLLADSPRRFLGESALAFNHALTQVAAYRSLTRRERSRLHEQAAAWLEDRSGEGWLDEVVGYHLERAHRDRLELGIDDDHTADLAARAGERLAGAGLAAYAKFDITAAENLLRRAASLLPARHPRRYPAMRRLAETYPVMGRLEEADSAFRELLETVTDERVARGLRLERTRVRMIAGPDPMTHQQVRRQAEQAFAAYSAEEDETGMSQACYLRAFVEVRAGGVAELEEVAREGLEHARRADFREEVGALWYVAHAVVTGPTPVEEAISICEEILAAHGQVHGGVLSHLACLYAMRGEFARAREMVGVAYDDIVERFRGVRRALTFVLERGARIEALAGDRDTAEEKLRRALGLATEVGERDQVAQLAGTLSRLVGGSNPEEAASLAGLSRETGPAESVVAQAMWRSAAALVEARAGEQEGAERLARQAVARIPEEMPDTRAAFLRDLATVLRTGGRGESADQVAAQARACYLRKGNLVAAGMV